jgi:hypothetical protein
MANARLRVSDWYSVCRKNKPFVCTAAGRTDIYNTAIRKRFRAETKSRKFSMRRRKELQLTEIRHGLIIIRTSLELRVCKYKP